METLTIGVFTCAQTNTRAKLVCVYVSVEGNVQVCLEVQSTVRSVNVSSHVSFMVPKDAKANRFDPTWRHISITLRMVL